MYSYSNIYLSRLHFICLVDMHADVEFPFANYRIDRKNRIDFTKSEATRWECCYSKFSLRHGYDVDNDRIASMIRFLFCEMCVCVCVCVVERNG